MKTFFFALAVACASALHAAEPLAWPQFRGPGGSGVAQRQRPPVELGPEKNVKWKTPVPAGLSSPIVAGDNLIITALDDGKLWTIAYRRVDGQEAWRAEAPATTLEGYHRTEGSPAASTPATDGERIVSYFGSCGLLCYDLDGHELWKVEMPTAETLGKYGTGVSPIIADGMAVLLRDVSNDPCIVAVDLKTGDVKWRRQRTSKGGYSTPTVWETHAGRQVVAAGSLQMVGYDLATGDEKWHVDGMPSFCCTSPVTSEGELFYAGWSPGGAGDSEFQLPSFDDLLKGDAGDADGDGALSREESLKGPWRDFFDANDVDKDGRITREEWNAVISFLASATNSAFTLTPGCEGDASSHVRWRQTKGLPYISSAIAYAGQYLMAKDGGIVTAYDAKTGELAYHKRALASGGYYASPVAANGNVYFASLRDGAITVIEAGADAPQVVARNEPLGERISATPAIADDALYVRTAGHLYAFAEQP